MILTQNSLATEQIHCTNVALVYRATDIKYNVTTLYNINARPREHVFTYAKEVCPAGVCLSVCLSVSNFT